MGSGKQKRTIASIRLTWRFYDTALLTWIGIAALPVVLLNWLIYDAAQIIAIDYEATWQESFPGAPSITSTIAVACAVSSLLVVFGMAAIGLFVTHRITGPYINIKKVCEAIRAGDLDRKLAFRKSDRLDDIADAFNGMVETLRKAPPKV